MSKMRRQSSHGYASSDRKGLSKIAVLLRLSYAGLRDERRYDVIRTCFSVKMAQKVWDRQFYILNVTW